MRLLSRRTLAVTAVAMLAAGCGKKGQAAQNAAGAADGAAGAAAAKAFLDKNAKEPGVTTTASGLQYKITKSGPATGEKPGLHDEVRVNYEGTLLNGEVFDSTYRSGQPAVFGVSDVVPGWTEALQLMRPGDEWLVYLPPALGYGPGGRGPIPPNAVLVFRMELLGVLKSGPANA